MPNQLYSTGYLKPKRVGRTTFDLSHERILTCNMGQLIPVLSELAYPGDHFNINTRCVVRFNPLIHPLMHRVEGTIHYFAVPLRLLYPKDQPDDIFPGGSDSRPVKFSFEEMLTSGIDGTDTFLDANFNDIKFFSEGNGGLVGPSSDMVPDPAYGPGSLWDFFRFEPSIGGNATGIGGPAARGFKFQQYSPFGEGSDLQPINAPWLAYHFIWWENYRDPFAKSTQPDDDLWIQSYNSQKWNPYLCRCFANWGIGSEFPFDPLRISDVRRPKYRAYEKDYFTSAQLSAQRGPAGVVLGSGSTDFLNLRYRGTDGLNNIVNATRAGGVGSVLNTGVFLGMQGVPADLWTGNGGPDGNPLSGPNLVPGESTSLFASPANAWNATAAGDMIPGNYLAEVGIDSEVTNQILFDINQLRNAYALQHHSEVNQRFGNRFTDYIYGHFDVVVRDDRLQRPEYIGGMKFPVIFSEVLQTSQSVDGQSALGELGGHGMAVSGDHCASYYVPEHCVIMGILSVMPAAVYGQGLDRQWIKNSRYDFYTPDFATIGEQAVLDAELLVTQRINESDPEITSADIFGYQGAFDHYRQRTSSYHGLMHTDLASWHLGRFFDKQPVLNTDFITTTSDDWDRAFAVTSEVADELVVTVGQQIHATRPMPYVSVPHIDGMED